MSLFHYTEYINQGLNLCVYNRNLASRRQTDQRTDYIYLGRNCVWWEDHCGMRCGETVNQEPQREALKESIGARAAAETTHSQVLLPTYLTLQRPAPPQLCTPPSREKIIYRLFNNSFYLAFLQCVYGEKAWQLKHSEKTKNWNATLGIFSSSYDFVHRKSGLSHDEYDFRQGYAQ